MKRMGLLITLLFLTGCVTVSVPPGAPTGAVASGKGIMPGMTRDQVQAAMNKPVTVGYEIDPASGAVSPVQMPNLYSTEILNVGNAVYQVDRYIVEPPEGQGIAEEKLFPVVYQDGILVAQGQDGLEKLQQK